MINYTHKNRSINGYFYLLNYPPIEKDLCKIEMKALFDKSNEDKYIFSDKYITPSTSPFIKEMISIIYTGDTVEEIVDYIERDTLQSNDFKVVFLKFDINEACNDERMKSLITLGGAITGIPDLHNPKEIFGVTKINNKWIFGVFSKNNFNWHRFDIKPFSYSTSLSVKLARSLCNIASKGDNNCSIVDPCCGIGTVVLNGLDLGLNIRGFELLDKVACNARENLDYFGYERDTILKKDMHTINNHFNVAILDLPYGIFTATTANEQKALIRKCGEISDKLLLVSSFDMTETLMECNFVISDDCIVTKSNFKRYIYICNPII